VNQHSIDNYGAILLSQTPCYDPVKKSNGQDGERFEKLCAEALYYQVDGLRLALSQHDVISVNDVVNQQMAAQPLEGLDVEPNDRLRDQLCRICHFTLPL
jgi:hypothetical protein